MKRMMLSALLVMSLTASSFAQQVCGFAQYATGATPNSFVVSGAVCNSEEAAIAVSYHRFVKKFDWYAAVDYVNARRGETSCSMVTDLELRRGPSVVKHDQDNDALIVQYWEYKTPTVVRTFVSAGYRDIC